MENLPEIAARHGLTVLLGAWVNADPQATRKEISKLIALVRSRPDVIQAVVIGNEVLLRKEVTGHQLAEYIRQVKIALPDVPVTYADVWEFWIKHREVAQVADFVTIHILPYWEDQPIGIHNAMVHVKKIREEVAAAIPGKKILIGEAGWPSAGRMREQALPSPVAQARFIRGFVALAEQEHWPYNLIEAFDQRWKRNDEGIVGGHWGLFDAYRVDKGVFSGRVSNLPHWPWLLLASAGFVFLVLPMWMRNKKEFDTRHVLGIASFIAVGSVLLVMQGRQFFLASRDGWEWSWAIMVLVLASGVWGFTLHALATGTKLHHVPMIAALKAPWGRSGWNLDILNGRMRLGLAACFLILSLGLVFDARYRNLNNNVFLIPAVVYTWLSSCSKISYARYALERFYGLALGASAFAILLNETFLNWQADIWVATCLPWAWVSWREGKGESLRVFFPYAVVAVLAGFTFVGIRYGIMESSQCIDYPTGGFCAARSVLGWMIYYQIFGWLSLLLTSLAIWRKRAGLFALAIITAMGSLNLYHGSLGAIALVMVGFSLVAFLPDTKKDISGSQHC